MDIVKEVQNDFLTLEYFDKYGGMCIATSYLLKNIICDKGLNAQVKICYLCVSSSSKELIVGYQKTGKENFIDAHAICIVDNVAVLDFALGSVREFMGVNFHKSLVVPYHPNPPIIARHRDNQYYVQWAIDLLHLNSLNFSGQRKLIDKNRRAAKSIFEEYKKFKQSMNVRRAM